MDDMELLATIQGLLIRVKVVTGWPIPDLESERRILYSEIAIHFQEKWGTLNNEEIMYAVRNYGGKDWGKNLNIQLLDEALEVYHKRRTELSKMEEQKKSKQDEPKRNPAFDWKGIIEADYQHFLEGKLSIDLMPHQCYDECVEVGFISRDAYEDYLSEARDKLIAKQTGLKEMAMLKRDLNEAQHCVAKIDEYKQGGEMVKFYAKRLCVIELFKQAQKKSIKNLFVYEQ